MYREILLYFIRKGSVVRLENHFTSLFFLYFIAANRSLRTMTKIYRQTRLLEDSWEGGGNKKQNLIE